MIKFNGKLAFVKTKSGVTASGSVAVNTAKNAFKNSKVLESTANGILKNSTVMKSIVKVVDVVKDSERITDSIQTKTAIIPAKIDQKTALANIIPPPPPQSTPKGINISNIPLPPPPTGVTFFTSSTQSRMPLVTPKNIPLSSSGVFTPFFTGSVTTGSAETAPTQFPAEGITVSSSIIPTEQIIFGETSFLMMPINPEMAEKTIGLELRKWEKPRVVAVVAENIRNGYQTSNAVIFKKLTSNRANVSKYIIYRKSIFKEREFQRIAELSNEQINVPQKYIEIVKSLGYNLKDSFVFVDNYIPINATYVYKIEVEWISTGAEPKQDLNLRTFAGFQLDSGLPASFFLSGTT